MKKFPSPKQFILAAAIGLQGGFESSYAQGIPAGYVPMALNGKAILENDFAAPATYGKEIQPVTQGWTARVAHATWKKTPEGVQSTWTSGHMPVVVFNGSFQDAVIEIDFRYKQEGTRWGGCRLSAANQTLDPSAYAASVWANQNSKSRKPGMVLERDKWSDGPTPVDHKPATFAPDTWYTLRMELLGDRVQATCNGVTVYGTHAAYALPKTSLWVGTGTSAHDLRRLRIYQGLPNPEWKRNATRLRGVIASAFPVQGAAVQTSPGLLRFLNLPDSPAGITVTDAKGNLFGAWSLPPQPAFGGAIGLPVSRNLPPGIYFSSLRFQKSAPLSLAFQAP